MAKILIIDDEDPIRKMLRKLLEKNGYEVMDACNGNEGIKFFKDHFENDQGNFGGYIGSCIDISENVEARRLILKEKESEINQLRGLLPLCSYCKKVRDDKGYWNQINVYIQEHAEVDISHGICPECAKKYYPDLDIYDD